MDAVEFFKTVNRLCKNKDCKECPVYKNNTCCMIGFDDDSIKSIEETVSKVEQWAKGHPVKTRKSEFLKMFPNANADIIEKTWCVAQFDKTRTCSKNSCGGSYCKKCKNKFWNEEVSE